MSVDPPDTMEPQELNESDREILEILHKGRATPAALKEWTGLSGQTVHNRLGRLVAAEHVEKVHNSGLYELIDDPRWKQAKLHPSFDNTSGNVERWESSTVPLWITEDDGVIVRKIGSADGDPGQNYLPQEDADRLRRYGYGELKFNGKTVSVKYALELEWLSDDRATVTNVVLIQDDRD